MQDIAQREAESAARREAATTTDEPATTAASATATEETTTTPEPTTAAASATATEETTNTEEAAALLDLKKAGASIKTMQDIAQRMREAESAARREAATTTDAPA